MRMRSVSSPEITPAAHAMSLSGVRGLLLIEITNMPKPRTRLSCYNDSRVRVLLVVS